MFFDGTHYVLVVCCKQAATVGQRCERNMQVLQRGFNDIGYHYVIRRDGAIEQGRPIEKPGAHAAGYNTNSIGICYAGGKGDNNQPEDNRTPEQKQAMYDLVASLKQQFPQAEITGHRDLPGVHKDCPCFSVKNEFKTKQV